MRYFVLLVALLAGCSQPEGAWQGAPGTFSSPSVEVRLEADGRTATLLQDLTFKDGRGKEWVVPKGSETDGASIPRQLWTAVGGPWEGKYRMAAIVHDRYCRHRTESWRDVHRMFYEACIAVGETEAQAKVLYAGVFHFGPRWGEPTGQQPMSSRPLALQKSMEEMKREIEADPGKSLEEIEKL